jgi:hypothetical protein
MLEMAAAQFCDPIILLVFVIVGDGSFHVTSYFTEGVLLRIFHLLQ